MSPSGVLQGDSDFAVFQLLLELLNALPEQRNLTVGGKHVPAIALHDPRDYVLYAPSPPRFEPQGARCRRGMRAPNALLPRHMSHAAGQHTLLPRLPTAPFFGCLLWHTLVTEKPAVARLCQPSPSVACGAHAREAACRKTRGGGDAALEGHIVMGAGVSLGRRRRTVRLQARAFACGPTGALCALNQALLALAGSGARSRLCGLRRS